MCGRFGRITSTRLFAGAINAETSSRLEDATGYNLPPGTYQPIVLNHPDTNQRTIGPAWWGFIPSFKDNDRPKPINARSDKLQGGFYKHAFAHQRCLIPADWWYEWQKNGSTKQPYFIKPQASNPFFFAGLWAKASRLPNDHPVSGQVTFAIITKTPHADITHIHDRQPAALTRDAARSWLDPGTSIDALGELLADGCFDAYTSWPIGKAVGNPRNDSPAIVEPVE
jgi:putative SOS response-associated peptidase YedK